MGRADCEATWRFTCRLPQSSCMDFLTYHPKPTCPESARSTHMLRHDVKLTFNQCSKKYILHLGFRILLFLEDCLWDHHVLHNSSQNRVYCSHCWRQKYLNRLYFLHCCASWGQCKSNVKYNSDHGLQWQKSGGSADWITEGAILVSSNGCCGSNAIALSFEVSMYI